MNTTISVGTISVGTISVGTIGVGTIGVGTIGVSTIGVSTIGVSTIGVSTIGVSTIGVSDGSDAKQPQPRRAEGPKGAEGAERTAGPPTPRPTAAEDRAFRWIGRCFYSAAVAGLGIFGTYIVLRGTGATYKNFDQWHDLISGLPMQRAADWIANIGIGMHYLMGAVLVLAWPILFSSRIRVRHRAVHRWTGRVYVAAGFLAGVGGLSFILARHNGTTAHTAFAIWGSVMMVSAVMSYVHARAKRFDLHRAWAIRLFAMVLGSWIFDLEYRAWEDMTGGMGVGTDEDPHLFDYVIQYAFFVPNLLVAEYFIRNKHKRIVMPRALKWPTLAALAIGALVFVYAIAAISGTHSGKYGRHLLGLIAG